MLYNVAKFSVSSCGSNRKNGNMLCELEVASWEMKEEWGMEECSCVLL